MNRTVETASFIEYAANLSDAINAATQSADKYYHRLNKLNKDLRSHSACGFYDVKSAYYIGIVGLLIEYDAEI